MGERQIEIEDISGSVETIFWIIICKGVYSVGSIKIELNYLKSNYHFILIDNRIELS